MWVKRSGRRRSAKVFLPRSAHTRAPGTVMPPVVPAKFFGAAPLVDWPGVFMENFPFSGSAPGP